MTEFTNGPARGKGDYIRRFPAPVFLRVVERKGAFKALDGHDDKPKPEEPMPKHVVEQGNLQNLFMLASATQQDLSTWI